MPATKKRKKRKHGRPVKHPWDDWFRRKVFHLVRGEDYDCQPHGLAVQIRREASARNFHVSVRIDGDVLYISLRKKTRRKRSA